jgi:predicted ABC-class ATPase
MDNGPVTMLSTIHSIHSPEWYVEKKRRKLRTTSTNPDKVRRVFGDAHRKLLHIPRAINDYTVT